ncbi:MAG: hypothetical protein AAGA92_05340 [Planctomycetota bacterium]
MSDELAASGMTNRDWFTLALRILGVWLLVQCLEIIPQVFFFSLVNSMGQATTYTLITLCWLAVRTALGLFLLFFASSIALRFYPKGADSPQVGSASGTETKPLRIGLQLLGVYALLLAAQSGGKVIEGVWSGVPITWDAKTGTISGGATYLNSLINLGLSLGIATVLLIWNEGVVSLIERFRYVPERDAYVPPALEEQEDGAG